MKSQVSIDRILVFFKTTLNESPFSLFKFLLLLKSGDIETNPGPYTQHLCAMHVNACSLRNKIDLFECECDNYDIITVSETWLTNSVDNSSLLLTNFHPPVRLDRDGDAHGGVAIYVRNSLCCKPRPDLHVDNLEAVWVETKINQEGLLIGCFYRPPSSPITYWNLISESIGKANDDLKKFVILGDFNSDWLTSPSSQLLDILKLYKLHQLVDTPTRITATTATCLDLIITQSPHIIHHTDVTPAFCSDHSVPVVHLKQHTPRNFNFKRTIYNYGKLDNDKFCNLLGMINWTEILSIYSIDKSCEMFTETFFHTAKQCMPIKTVTIRSRDVEWITCEIRRLLRQRNKLHKKAKYTNSRQDWEHFRSFRNYVTGKIRERKREYYEEMNECISNPRQFGSRDWWKLVNSFMSKKGIISDEIPPLCKDGVTYYTNKEKANVFNDHFIQQSTLDDDGDTLPEVEFRETEINEIIISIEEVKTIIKNLNPNKATGPDAIHNKLLIAAVDVISPHLARFFNRCLAECNFPSLWKLANVTPVHKKGNKDECTNYRPISLLSCVGKVFERCIHKHVYYFLSTNHIITESQSGFLPGDSTVNQLLCIYNNLCFNWDQGITSQSVYFDISKAFDRVWHRGLILKLESIGIRGRLLDWFRHYLFERKQVVVIKGETSNTEVISAGVPQGSVLGPLLFLVYINDIVQNIHSIIKLFADDTSMSLGMADRQRRAEILSADLQTITNWSIDWKVRFNELKTDLLTMKRDSNLPEPLHFGNTVLEDKPHHKHLGITFQSNCRWNEHINNIASKVKLLTNLLRSFKYTLRRKALETMYTSFILPIFDYADLVWDNCTQSQSQILENLHLEAIRIITGLPKGTSHNTLYIESGFCSLKERRRRHKIIMYHKIINDLTPEYLGDLLPPLVSTTNPYHRRRPLERAVPSHKTDLYKTSFFPDTTRLWNQLPTFIQQTTSISQLKHFLKQNDPIVPPYYYSGTRTEQYKHCQLRCNMSSLNSDLFNRHLTNDPSCACGHVQETAEHYLLYCPNFAMIRAATVATLPCTTLSTKVLLYGDKSFTMTENEEIFDTVHTFIRESKRL